MTDDLAGIRCAICDRLAPITVADLVGPDPDDTEYTGWSIADLLKPTAPPSGHDALIVATPTGGWMNVPDAIDTEPDPRIRDEDYDDTHRPEFDPDRIMCFSHASPTELDAWLDQLNDTDEIVAQTMRDIRADDVLGRPAGERASDAMMGIPPPDEHDD